MSPPNFLHLSMFTRAPRIVNNFHSYRNASTGFNIDARFAG